MCKKILNTHLSDKLEYYWQFCINNYLCLARVVLLLFQELFNGVFKLSLLRSSTALCGRQR